MATALLDKLEYWGKHKVVQLKSGTERIHLWLVKLQTECFLITADRIESVRGWKVRAGSGMMRKIKGNSGEGKKSDGRSWGVLNRTKNGVSSEAVCRWTMCGIDKRGWVPPVA